MIIYLWQEHNRCVLIGQPLLTGWRLWAQRQRECCYYQEFKILPSSELSLNSNDRMAVANQQPDKWHNSTRHLRGQAYHRLSASVRRWKGSIISIDKCTRYIGMYNTNRNTTKHTDRWPEAFILRSERFHISRPELNMGLKLQLPVCIRWSLDFRQPKKLHWGLYQEPEVECLVVFSATASNVLQSSTSKSTKCKLVEK